MGPEASKATASGLNEPFLGPQQLSGGRREGMWCCGKDWAGSAGGREEPCCLDPVTTDAYSMSASPLGPNNHLNTQPSHYLPVSLRFGWSFQEVVFKWCRYLVYFKRHGDLTKILKYIFFLPKVLFLCKRLFFWQADFIPQLLPLYYYCHFFSIFFLTRY